MTNFAYLLLWYQPEEVQLEQRVLMLRRQGSPLWFNHPPMKGRPMEKFLRHPGERRLYKYINKYTYYLPNGISYEHCFKGKYPSLLCFPGGQADRDESLSDCALREFSEETGIIIPVEQILSSRLYSAQQGGTSYGGYMVEVSPGHFSDIKQSIVDKLTVSQTYRDETIELARSGRAFNPPSPPLTDDELTLQPPHTVGQDGKGQDWEMSISDAEHYFNSHIEEGLDWFLEFVKDMRPKAPVTK